MPCNIDTKGRVVRLVIGTLMGVTGIVLWSLHSGGDATAWWPWTTSIGLLAIGSFQIYEGCAGWCMIRAMGFKTRI